MKTKTPPKVKPAPVPDAAARRAAFLAEFKALCEKHGMQVAATPVLVPSPMAGGPCGISASLDAFPVR